MLFVSRLRSVGNGYAYGVVDTDDGVEQFCSISDIAKALRRGLKIEGVTVKDGDIAEILPHQLSEYSTSLQTTLALMHDIFITTYRDEITSITWSFGYCKPLSSVRLSDFGHSCAGRIFQAAQCLDLYKATFIVEDELEFTDSTFIIPGELYDKRIPETVGCKLDVRSMKDEAKLSKLYRAVVASQPLSAKYLIIDHEDRKRRMLATRG